jgi:hypothetical protein
MGAIENYLKTADLAPWLSQPQARPGVLQNLQQLAAGAKGPARPPPVPAAALRGAVPGAQGMMPRINQALMSNLKHAEESTKEEHNPLAHRLKQHTLMGALMGGAYGAGTAHPHLANASMPQKILGTLGGALGGSLYGGLAGGSTGAFHGLWDAAHQKAASDASHKFGLDKLALGMPGFMNTLMQAGRQGAGAGLARFQNVGGMQGALQGLQRGAQDFHAMGGSGALGKALGLGAAGAAGLYGAGRMFGAGQQAARPQQDPRMGQQRPMR